MSTDSSTLHRSLWKRILKWSAITIAGVILVLLAVISIAVAILSPGRLTPLVLRHANEMINGQVDASRIELTFWSSFPKLVVEVDSLTLVSHSLHNLPDSIASQYPALEPEADSLLSIGRFHAGINLPALVRGHISLYDVVIERPRLNVVILSDSVNNFNILPATTAETDTTASSASIPPISINRFAIVDGFPARVRIPADSIDATVTLNTTEFHGNAAPVYTLSLQGNALGKALPLQLSHTPFALDGNIAWNQATPQQINLSDFTLSVGDITTSFSTELAFADSLTLNTLHISVPNLSFEAVRNLWPETPAAPPLLDSLHTDLAIDFTARLLNPFTVGSPSMPDVEADLAVKASHFKLNKLNLSKLNLSANAVIHGSDLDASTVNISTLSVAGRAIDFTLSAKISHPLSDPAMSGKFSGAINFAMLPAELTNLIKASVTGTLRGKFDFNTRKSRLKPKTLHRTYLDGSLQLDNFHMAMCDTSLITYIHHADFSLGTHSKVKSRMGATVDSMFTASLSIDTMSLDAAGYHISSRNLQAGIGSRNVAATTDTSLINPLGGSFKSEFLSLRSDADSALIRLRQADILATLRRFNNDAHAPQVDINLKAARIGFADNRNRAFLASSHATFTVHPRVRGKMSKRMAERFDSLAVLYPTLSADSLRSLARTELIRTRRQVALLDSIEGRQKLNFALDNSMRTLLRRWQASGTLTIDRARLFTPFFPSRNTLSNVDLSFSTDSVNLHNTNLKVGRSDFRLSGSIHGISRSLTSTTGGQLSIDFAMLSDTIDLNDLSATLLRGVANSSNLSPESIVTSMDDADSDILFDEMAQPAPSAEATPLIIPSNLNANINLRARNIFYNNLKMRHCISDIEVFDGAINVSQLHADTDIGSMLFSALYSAPSPSDISIASTMTLKKVRLHEVLHMIPRIDSIMPLLKEVEGIVDADAALTATIQPDMNIDLQSVSMALKLSGDSLVLLDSDTFRTISKWLLFKNKQRNMINHMDVEIAVTNGQVDLYPFIFDMDRYRLGVYGSNDAAFNLNYHVAVLKSPLPFKFGVNIKGTPEDMKIRLGKARLDEKSVASSRHIADTVRINLKREITSLFRKGIRTAGAKGLQLRNQAQIAGLDEHAGNDTISHADSLEFIRQGLIAPPPEFESVTQATTGDSKAKKTKKSKTKR